MSIGISGEIQASLRVIFPSGMRGASEVLDLFVWIMLPFLGSIQRWSMKNCTVRSMIASRDGSMFALTFRQL